MKGGNMGASRKTALFVCALVIGLALAVALVRAAVPGQDFEWLSVSEGGIRIGTGEGEGEGEGQGQPAGPPANTLEFAAGSGSGQILFHDGGFAGFRNSGGLGTYGEAELPESMLEMGNSSGAYAMLTSQTVGMASAGYETENEGEGGGTVFVQNSAVVCMSNGDVVVYLARPEESKSSMMGAPGGAESARMESPYSEAASRRIPVRWPLPHAATSQKIAR